MIGMGRRVAHPLYNSDDQTQVAYDQDTRGFARERTWQPDRARGHLRPAVALRPGISAYETAIERSTA